MKKNFLIIAALFTVLYTILLSPTAFTYDMTYFSSEAQREFNNIMAQVKSDMSDVEKLLAVHDYIVLNFEYDNNHILNTAEDALTNKRGSCQGYAEVMICVMDELGLENAFVRSYSMDHSWNMVKLDGEWYHIDVTWDDPISDKYGYVRHDFFLVSDEYISAYEHYDWRAYDWDEFVWYEDYGVMNIKAISNKYDEYFWQAIDTPMQYYDKKWYYISKYGNDTMNAGINCYSFTENKAESIISSYEISSINIYNEYMYILDMNDNIYMSPISSPCDVALIMTVSDYSGKTRDELNGVFLENGLLKYAIADDEYYEMTYDPEYGNKAKYPDYVKYRHFYNIDLRKYRYSDYSVSWSYDNGVLSIGSRSGKISIPAIAGRPWSNYSNDIVHIDVQDGVRVIDDNAFKDLHNLKTVSLPDSLEIIGRRAFQGCAGLKLIEFPKDLSAISESAFEYCYDLAVITLDANVSEIAEDAFYGCGDLAEVYYAGSETEFKEINIGTGNNRITDTDVIYNYKKPMILHMFDTNESVVILWLYNNKVAFDECVSYKMKQYYDGEATDYLDAVYSFDDKLLSYENNQLFAVEKGKSDVSIKVDGDEITFCVYTGELRNKPFEVEIHEQNIIPIIASYDKDGFLVDCHIGNLSELYSNGIDYIDYGGESKLFLWDGLSSMHPVVNEWNCLL